MKPPLTYRLSIVAGMEIPDTTTTTTKPAAVTESPSITAAQAASAATTAASAVASKATENIDVEAVIDGTVTATAKVAESEAEQAKVSNKKTY